jgi:hypothetical protein
MLKCTTQCTYRNLRDIGTALTLTSCVNVLICTERQAVRQELADTQQAMAQVALCITDLNAYNSLLCSETLVDYASLHDRCYTL